jgi:hypothetical protein
MTEGNQAETLEFLSAHRLPYVCVDMPQGHRDSIPPVLAVTDPDLAVVRLHGHPAKWDSRDIHERFGYHYSQQELAEWAPKIAALAEDADDTHVLLTTATATTPRPTPSSSPACWRIDHPGPFFSSALITHLQPAGGGSACNRLLGADVGSALADHEPSILGCLERYLAS